MFFFLLICFQGGYVPAGPDSSFWVERETINNYLSPQINCADPSVLSAFAAAGMDRRQARLVKEAAGQSGAALEPILEALPQIGRIVGLLENNTSEKMLIERFLVFLARQTDIKKTVFALARTAERLNSLGDAKVLQFIISDLMRQKEIWTACEAVAGLLNFCLKHDYSGHGGGYRLYETEVIAGYYASAANGGVGGMKILGQ